MPNLKLSALIALVLSVCLQAQDTVESQLPGSDFRNSQDLIQQGDLVEISLLQDSSFNTKENVSQSGTIPIPYIGDYEVKGKTVDLLKSELSSVLLEQYYNDVTLNITVTKSIGGVVYIYGAVKEPGIVSLEDKDKLSISQAVALVGGLTSWANPSGAYIIRRTSTGEAIEIKADLGKTVQNIGGKSSDGSHLIAEDELYIPGIDDDQSQLLMNDDREIIVVGQVNSPGIITFAPGEECTLMRAVFKAGGLTKFAKGTAVKLIRYRGENRTVEEVNVDAIVEEGFLDQDVELLAGDMLIVPQKLVNF